MTITKVGPLPQNQPIVDPNTGAPTPFFLRQWIESRNVTLTVGEVELDVAQLSEQIMELLLRQIVAGVGLTGGGALGGGDITIDLGAVLDNLLDVDTVTTPPTDGQVLSFDILDNLWKPSTVAGGAGAFSGARTELTAPFPVPAGVFTAIPWNTATVDAGGFWNIGAPTKFTIPSGISVVDIFSGAASIGAVAGQWILEIRDKLGNLVARSETDTPGGDAISTATGPIQVIAGDFFEAYIFATNARPLDAVPASFFGIHALSAPGSSFSSQKVMSRVSLGF